MKHGNCIAMEWDDLRYFLAVARSGSLIAAGRTLNTSAATVARRVDALESRLGARLFDRKQTGYALTESGEAIRLKAEEAEEAMLSVEREALGRDLRASGKVRVAASDDIAANLIAPHLPGFRRSYPGIAVELVAQMNLVNLTRREADIAIRGARPTTGDLVIRRAGSWGFGLYASKCYVDAHKLEPGGQDFSKVEIITWTEEWAHLRGGPWLAEHAPTAKVALASDSRRVHHNACKAGMGLAVLPCFLADRDPDLVRLLPPEAVVSLDLWLVVHRDLLRTARVRAVMDFLHDAVGKIANESSPVPA
jgi:DNA-binding transcriptional LysR family regulator